MFGDESLELADEPDVAAQSEIGLDPPLERCDPQVLETGNFRLGERLEREIGECRSAPEVQAFVEEGGCAGGVTDCDRRSTLVKQPLEAARVELVRPKFEHITRGERAEEVGSEDLADLRDMDTHRLKRGRRRSLAPKLLDQAIARDHAVQVHQQDREHSPFPPATKGNHPTPVEHLERAQDPELHRELQLTVAPSAPRTSSRTCQLASFIWPLCGGSI